MRETFCSQESSVTNGDIGAARHRSIHISYRLQCPLQRPYEKVLKQATASRS